MTSTPVPSLNDESLNGSWIDINSASQIHSPMDDDSPEFLRPPYSLAESVQSLGLISFQVERFLQEAQRNQNSQQNLQHQPQQAPAAGDDNNSGIYMSDTDGSLDGLDSRALYNSLKKHNNESNNNDFHSKLFHPMNHNDGVGRGAGGGGGLLKSGDGHYVDQLSDSLSLLSRASAMGEPAPDQAANFQDFDWLWDWTAQPEYFTGQEWKVYAPKQDYLMRQRQLYCASLNKGHEGTLFSGEVISLLFLTNILSIIIGAGLTYSILMRRSAV